MGAIKTKYLIQRSGLEAWTLTAGKDTFHQIRWDAPGRTLSVLPEQVDDLYEFLTKVREERDDQGEVSNDQ